MSPASSTPLPALFPSIHPLKDRLTMKTLIALLWLLPVVTQAAQMTFTAAPDVTTNSIVVADFKKLKTSLAAALAAYPGEECIAFADTNAVPSCPGFAIANGWTFPLATGFPVWPDPIDPRRALRIDGLKTADLVNFISPGQCTPAGCPTVPPPVPMTSPSRARRSNSA